MTIKSSLHKLDDSDVEGAKTAPSHVYDLSVVVPTRNERGNIWPFLESLQNALRGLYVEIIFVDDSDDDTPVVIHQATRMMASPRLQIRLEHRIAGTTRARGLATAVVLGLKLAQAAYVAVLDADLQHPPQQLRVLYDQAIAQHADLAIASRYIKEGSHSGLDGARRIYISRGMKWLAKLLFPGQLWGLSDPLGGFFLLRRSLLTDVALRPIGYKILLEILLRCRWQRAIEVPYHFQARVHGQSKANLRQGTLTLQHILRLWREVPAAGRIWKIGALALLNLLMTWVLVQINLFFPEAVGLLSAITFVVMLCLDFVLFNRFLFPAPKGTSNAASPSSLPASVDAHDTVVLPSTVLTGASATDLKQRAQPGQQKKVSDRFLPLIAAAIMLLALGWISYVKPGALLIPATLLIGTALALTKSVNRDEAIRIILAIAVGVATVDYVSWRLAATNWQGWWIAAPLLGAETLGAIHVLGFQFTMWPWSPPKMERREDPTQHPIFIFIPTVNEGIAILRPTLEGVIAAREQYLARYPYGRVTIAVCNDGRVAQSPNWQETERLARGLGVCCVTRTQKGGAKAGNIEHARHALQVTGDALLVIFDADQIAQPDFLLKTIPPFGDPKMGWVQTGQYYANRANPVSRWADDQQSLFYNLLCPGKAALNAAFICGTNVVIRAAALDEIGGLPQDSVTEDFAAAITLHPRWRSVYLTDVLATGLGPLDIPSYLKQQGRWALGTLGVLRTHWREIMLPRKQGLRMGQRVQYFLACTHYLCGLRDVIYLISPMLFILTGIPAVRSTYLSDYLWHFLPYCLLSMGALWYSARGITGLRGIIIGFGSFPVLIGSLLAVVFHRRVGFAVTAKQRHGKRSLGYLWIYCVSLLFCVACLIWATRVRGQEQTSLSISVLWVVYSMLMLGSFLWLSFKDVRFQAAAQRSGAPHGAVASQTYPSKLAQRQRGLHGVWHLGWATLIACPVLLSSFLGSLPFLQANQPEPFLIGQEKLAAPYLGVSLPIQLLETRPPVLERELGAQFSIIGRTQDVVHDKFDTHWAEQLAAQHARPWITLQFGVFGPDQKPPLDANLPAIYNGLHDPDLKRWAEAIRAYGKPVYLTFLPHVDRNWSLSSAVKNGGIPQDVPKAWMHVQAVFRAVGATNVAWVWAPADPIHDQAYAPPASTIDAVLQSFINYPGTTWGNPEAVLGNLVHHYPTKPIFVEASADGPAAQKAAWLTKLGLAISNIPSVYALLYHEGGPALALTSLDIEEWSLASDPQSLAAMRSIVANLHKKTQVHLYQASYGMETISKKQG